MRRGLTELEESLYEIHGTEIPLHPRELIGSPWVQFLEMLASRSSVRASCRYQYRDDTILHAGMAIGPLKIES